MSTELRERALERIRQRRKFVLHVVAQVAGLVFATIVWAVTEYHNAGGWPTGFRTGRRNHDWDPWIIYPWLAAAVALGIHAWVTSSRRPVTDADVDREVARMEGS